MNKDLEAKMKNLTDSSFIAVEYHKIELDNIDELTPRKQEYERGESIITGQLLFGLENNEQYIKDLRFNDLVRYKTLIDLIAQNNQRLLDFVQEYVAQEQKK